MSWMVNMSKSKYGQKRTVPFRRKRESKTDYRRRFAMLKSGEPMLVVRKHANTVICQVVEYSPDGDRIVAAASSRDLKKLGWKGHPGNTPSAYLTGLLLGQKAKKKVKSAVFYLGLQSSMPGSKVYAALKGAIDAGIEVPHGEKALPSDERISGKHIVDYAAKLKSDKAAYDRQFSAYAKQGVKPEELVKAFDDMKKKILAM